MFERSLQVTLMGSLYSHARKVYICMGSNKSTGFDSDIPSVITDATSLAEDGILPTLSSRHPLRTDSRWHQIAALAENQWFQRTWVVQEAALAQNPRVLYGEVEFGYRDLTTVLRWLNQSSWAAQFGIPAFFIHLQWADWKASPLQPEYTFLDLLSHASLLSCSDPRDKIYAFLGHPLAQTINGSLIVTPNYEKSPSVVFLELSKVLVQQIGLRTLASVEHTPLTILQDFPSWVTQWDVAVALNDIWIVPNDAFHASAGLTPKLPVITTNNSLVLRGVILDRIQQSFLIDVFRDVAPLFQDVITGEETTFLKSLQTLHERGDGSPYDDHTEAFCQTLCIGMRGLNKKLYATAIIIAKYFANLTSEQKSLGIAEKLSTLRDDDGTYFSMMRGFCTNRSLVVTEKGYYALAPLLTMPGDVACVLNGADVPFILRPVEDSQKFKLLGESYVHGMMEGQVSEMMRQGELFEQTITLH